ncbi:MAG: DUF1552 domain-containing protein [Myxococcota bacterium]|nr:DUF1552 domain-containing protein [Myxococcota bacterium]
MKHTAITRRRFLRGSIGASAVTIGLPWLEIFHARAQGASPFPTRFALFCWGNGILPARWIPDGVGSDDAWSLSEQLMPLSAVKSHLTVVTGCEVKTDNIIPHHSGAAGFLSGRPLLVKTHKDQTFRGPSIDQVIATQIGTDTRFGSLEFGAEPGRGLSYNGPDSQNPPERSPAAFFQRIFGPQFRAPGDMSAPDPRLALRRSVLDAVMADFSDFKKNLGHADRNRLDEHLDGVRDLEKRIQRLERNPADLDACVPPRAPTDEYEAIDGRPQLSARNRILCDIAVMALACDQTRVVSNFITKPLTNLLLADARAGHHQLTHDEPGEQPQVHRIILSVMAELRYFIEALRSVREGNETLLDHMALLATSDISYGRTHALDEFPILIAGGANGRLKTNMHYRSTLAENTSKVMLSLVRACGINAATFGGEAGEASDGLGAIEV